MPARFLPINCVSSHTLIANPLDELGRAIELQSECAAEQDQKLSYNMGENQLRRVKNKGLSQGALCRSRLGMPTPIKFVSLPPKLREMFSIALVRRLPVPVF